MPRLAALLLLSAAVAQDPVGALVEGGPVSPDGKTQVVCDLPVELRKHNIGSPPPRGPGCCVFRSIDHAAHFQNVPALYDLPEQLVKAGIPGGGDPRKVDQIIKRFGPNVAYVQHTGGDLAFLRAAIKTGRMPGVTYAGMDMHYGSRQKIAHMVNLVYLDDAQACILDNNYVGANQLVWMSVDEFKVRWLDMSGGWSVVILNPPPPPVPRP